MIVKLWLVVVDVVCHSAVMFSGRLLFLSDFLYLTKTIDEVTESVLCIILYWESSFLTYLLLIAGLANFADRNSKLWSMTSAILLSLVRPEPCSRTLMVCLPYMSLFEYPEGFREQNKFCISSYKIFWCRMVDGRRKYRTNPHENEWKSQLKQNIRILNL